MLAASNQIKDRELAILHLASGSRPAIIPSCSIYQCWPLNALVYQQSQTCSVSCLTVLQAVLFFYVTPLFAARFMILPSSHTTFISLSLCHSYLIKKEMKPHTEKSHLFLLYENNSSPLESSFCRLQYFSHSITSKDFTQGKKRT